VLSLKTLIDNANPDMARAMYRVVGILLQGISRNAFPLNEPALADFQAEIEDLRIRFGEVHEGEAAVALACGTVRSMEKYASSADQLVSAEARRMRESVALLTDSLLKASHGSKESARHLAKIRTDLETVPVMHDIVAINDKLRGCLGEICDEVEQQRRRHEEIQQDLTRAAKRDCDPADIDSATGLPGVSAAIHAIRSAIARGTAGHLLVFGVEHMQAINLRFGFKVGDEVLLMFGQNIARHLDPEDVLFRWRGTCFVAVSARPAPDLRVASEVAKIVATKLEYSGTIGSREVMLPVVGVGTTFNFSGQSAVDDVLLRLDNFALHPTTARDESRGFYAAKRPSGPTVPHKG
jgi:GGDEF domain-containing protein